MVTRRAAHFPVAPPSPRRHYGNDPKRVSNEHIQRLEEKIAYLERHVTEQDKAMLEMADDIAKLRRELTALRDRPTGPAPGGGDDLSADERPPHY